MQAFLWGLEITANAHRARDVQLTIISNVELPMTLLKGCMNSVGHRLEAQHPSELQTPEDNK